MAGSDVGSLSSLQVMALSRESAAAVRLSQEGIEALRRLDGAEDFYHLPMQLLAQGFERLLKLTLALAELETTGGLPSSKRLRADYGHDIVALTDAVVERVGNQPAYARRPAVQEDLHFIRHDAHLRQMLAVLSTFGAWSRYYRLEEFLDPDGVAPEDDPDRAWEAIETQILRRHPDWIQQLGSKAGGRAFETIARDITATLDRFARAITRMWTLGALHEEAQRHLGTIKGFLFLRDHELGQPADNR
jgi:hypothetical protein